jgi:virginiamycin B lyase
MTNMMKSSLCVALASAWLAAPAAAQQKPSPLPEGDGKALVEAMCTNCHGLNFITNSSGYTADQWKFLISTMADVPSVPLAKAVEYLAANFPPNTKRAPKLMPGDMQISFKQWKTPTLGARSRDPIEGIDGSIWFVGQYGNVVGRIDPKTNEIKEWPLPSGARAHSIAEDKSGNIWYTGNANGTIGKLDPKTGKFTVYPMPDPAVRDPHSLEFDPKGILWFSAQQSNFVGRLDPATGAVKVWALPTPKTNPYGVRMDSKGTPWIASNGSNRVISINPETLELKEHVLPRANAQPRRIAIDSQDVIWAADVSGYLVRFDPKTGAVKEWPSPSGAASSPYGITIVNDIIWYNESGQRPDALVRFDPKTEKFQSWPIPSGPVFAGIVRNMNKTRDGNLLIHQTSTNHILLVDLKSGGKSTGTN